MKVSLEIKSLFLVLSLERMMRYVCYFFSFSSLLTAPQIIENVYISLLKYGLEKQGAYYGPSCWNVVQVKVITSYAYTWL